MSAIRLSRRAANYSKAEIDCLLSYLEENPDLVSIKLGGQYSTTDDIRAAWDDLADKVSAIGGYFGTKRTGTEVKKKWADLKSRVKAKASSLTIESDRPGSSNMKLTHTEERALAIISRDMDDQSQIIGSASVRGSGFPSVKVYSFHNESNSGERPDSEFDDGSNVVAVDESGILQEIKLSGNEDKKRRISEAFSTDRKSLGIKKLKIASEEEQLQELCNAQQEINVELRSVKEILKKCQLSIEKIALLKRAELRLKCAKYGVDFEDLFD